LVVAPDGAALTGVVGAVTFGDVAFGAVVFEAVVFEAVAFEGVGAVVPFVAVLAAGAASPIVGLAPRTAVSDSEITVAAPRAESRVR
jgi:hypothetical protein